MIVKGEGDWVNGANGLGRREMLCNAFRGVEVCGAPLLKETDCKGQGGQR